MSPKKVQYDHSGCFPKHRGGAQANACVKRNEAAGTPLPVKVFESRAVVTVTEKRCSGCGMTKPASAFNRNAHRRDGLQALCRPCKAEQLRRPRYKSNKRNYRKQAWYGITSAQVDAMIEERGGRCDICAQVEPLAVDHVHLPDGSAGHVRGLACKNGCNNHGIAGIDRLMALGITPDLDGYVTADYSANPIYGKYGRSKAVREWAAARDEEQGGRCFLCQQEPDDRGLCTDHSHDTGHCRQRVCQPCNLLIACVDKLHSLGLTSQRLWDFAARGPAEIPEGEAWVPRVKSHKDCDHPATLKARNACRRQRAQDALSSLVTS